MAVAFVSPDYFRTLGVPMFSGREFNDRDRAGASTPVVVNERFARRHLPPGSGAVGATFIGNGRTVFEVIGVAGNSASIGLRNLDQDVLYLPGGRGVLHVRSAVPPATLTTDVRAAVQRVDRQVPVFDVRTLAEQVELTIGREQTFATLSVTFGVLALALASIGLFGVMTNAVTRRTNELGIRLALGASPSLLTRSVFGEAAVLVGCGALLGVPAAWLMARAIRGLFFATGASDWQGVALPLTLLAVVSAAAAWLPAYRAAHINPLNALRSE
jgi:predicted lysophospholipase L1 biosynthesis ABC-type transport system permease subunit